MRNKHILIFVLAFFLSLSLSASVFVFRDFFTQFYSLGLLGLFLINAIGNASLFVSGPSFLSVVAAGAIYNPFIVALVSSFGAGMGDMVSYVIGASGGKSARKKFEKNFWLRVLEGYFKSYGGVIIFLLALIPNPVFDAIGIVAGLFNYPLGRFFILIFLGRFIRYTVLAQIGTFL